MLWPKRIAQSTPVLWFNAACGFGVFAFTIVGSRYPSDRVWLNPIYVGVGAATAIASAYLLVLRLTGRR
jgi:hypothetical protein